MTVYDEDVFETWAPADATSTALVSPQSVDETGAAADVVSSTAVLIAGAAESAPAVDAPSAGGVFVETVTESMTASDLTSGTVTPSVFSLTLRGRIYDNGVFTQSVISADGVFVQSDQHETVGGGSSPTPTPEPEPEPPPIDPEPPPPAPPPIFYDDPSDIVLIGSGHTGAIQDNAVGGTVIGPLAAVPATPGGILATPLVFSVIANSKFSVIVAASGSPTLEYVSGTLTASVDEVLTIRCTTGDGSTADVVFTISVTAIPVTSGYDRFTPISFPVYQIAVTWSGDANDPTVEPLGTRTNACKEGKPNSWTAHSTDYPNIDGRTFSTINALYDWQCVNNPGGDFTLCFGIAGNLYNYADAGLFYYEAQTIRPGVPVKRNLVNFAIKGGVEDLGFDGNGIRIWGRPTLRIRPPGQASSSTGVAFIDMLTDDQCQMRYRFHGIEVGPFDSEIYGGLVTTDDPSTATTTYKRLVRSGMAFIHGDGWGVASITHCHIRLAYSHGLNCTLSRALFRQNGFVQCFDTKITKCGLSSQEHNVYLQGLNNATFGYNATFDPAGHALKFDGIQRIDAYANFISTGDIGDASALWWARRHGMFTAATAGFANLHFNNSGLIRKTIPAIAPYTITLDAYVSDVAPATGINMTSGTLTVQAGSGVVAGSGTAFLQAAYPGATISANGETHTVISVASNGSLTTDAWGSTASGLAWTITLPTKFVGGSYLTKVSTGTPGASQFSVSVTGNTSTSSDVNTGRAVMAFSAADAGKDIDISCRGFFLTSDNFGDGRCVNFDSPNQDAYFWDNKFEPTLESTNPSVFLLQSRHNLADQGHNKQPPYFKAQPFVGQIRRPEFSAAGTINGVVQFPAMRIGQVQTAAIAGATQVAIQYIGPPLGDLSNSTDGPGLLSTQSPYHLEIRYSDGTKSPTYNAVWVSGNVPAANGAWPSNTKMVVNITTGGGLTQAISPGDVIRIKASVASWDQPALVAGPQADRFYRGSAHYFPYEITTVVGGIRTLDFSKQSPSMPTRKYGIPAQYLDQNMVVPTAASTAARPYFVNVPNQENGTYADASSAFMILPAGPLNSSDGSWPHDAQAGDFDFDLHTPRAFWSDASGGTGIDGGDGLRDDMMVVRHLLPYDAHLSSSKRFNTPFHVFDTSPTESIYTTDEMMGVVKFLPPTGVTLDFDGLVRVPGPNSSTTGPPAGYPSTVNFEVVTGCGPTEDTIIVSSVAGLVANQTWIAVECTSQFGDGWGTWGAAITAVNSMTKAVTFSPPLPSIGSVGAAHALAITANVSPSTRGGRCAAMPIAYSTFFNRGGDPAGWVYPDQISYP